MAIVPNYLISYDVDNLTLVTVRDNTTFDLTTPITSIYGTRFKFATNQSLAAPTTNISDTEISAFVEYEVASGTFTYLGRTFVTGDIFCFSQDTTIPSTVVVNETGYFIPISTYLPTNTGGVSFTPTQTGLGGSDVYFPDLAYSLTYQLYSTRYGAGSVTVASSTTFLVTGASENDYITISGETYYVGEVFTKSTTFTFANGSGTNYVVEYENEVTDYFYTYYEAWGIFRNYVQTMATSYQVSQQVYSDFLKILSRLNQIAMYAEQNFGVSLEGVQALLDDIDTNYNPNPA